MKFEEKSIISIKDLEKEEIEHILKTAEHIEKNPEKHAEGKILATIFYEPSTRTRLSFESAMKKLGGRVIGFADKKISSDVKGESLKDSIRIIDKYADIAAIRHPLDGSAKVASEHSKVPVINGGDGSNQHPTQTLLDLYTIKKLKKRIEGLDIAIVGDLKYGRTTHSLSMALSQYNCKIRLVSPEKLKLPTHVKKYIEREGANYEENRELENAIKKSDIIYMTRMQKERFPDPEEYEEVKDTYRIEKADLEQSKEDMKIMHPLPRNKEIAEEVDETEHAYYFEQAENGVPIRQALMCLCLGVIE